MSANESNLPKKAEDISSETEDVSLFGGMDLMVGTKVADRWLISQLIGEGGMSQVYKARDTKTEETVLVKVLHSALVAKVRNLKRLELRLKQLSELKHDRIVKLIDCVISSVGEVYIIQEYLACESLEEVLSKVGHLSPERAAPIFAQCAAALQMAAAKGVLHKDLKPSNILIVESESLSDVVKVTDFGIAWVLSDESEHLKSSGFSTTNREVFGSPLYLSPEQCAGRKFEARSDLYSLGCLMYETIAGKPPFVGKNILETAYKHMSEAPRPFTMDGAWAGSISTLNRMQSIVFKCLEKEPEARYANAGQLELDLTLMPDATEAAWQTQALALVRIGSLKSKRRRKRRFNIPREVFLYAVVGLVLTGLVIGWAWSILGSDTREVVFMDDSALWIASERRTGLNTADFGEREEAAQTELAQIARDEGKKSKNYLEAEGRLIDLYARAGHWNEMSTEIHNILNNVGENADPHLVGQLYAKLSFADTELENKDAIEKDGDKAMELLTKAGPAEEPNLTVPLQCLGNMYFKAGQLDKALPLEERLFAILERYKRQAPRRYFSTACCLADIYRRQKRYEDAEFHYKLGLDWSLRNRSHYTNVELRKELMLDAEALYGLGLVYEGMKRTDKAGSAFTDAFNIAHSVMPDNMPFANSCRKHYTDLAWRRDPLGSFWNTLNGKAPELKAPPGPSSSWFNL